MCPHKIIINLTRSLAKSPFTLIYLFVILDGEKNPFLLLLQSNLLSSPGLPWLWCANSVEKDLLRCTVLQILHHCVFSATPRFIRPMPSLADTLESPSALSADLPLLPCDALTIWSAPHVMIWKIITITTVIAPSFLISQLKEILNHGSEEYEGSETLVSYSKR